MPCMSCKLVDRLALTTQLSEALTEAQALEQYNSLMTDSHQVRTLLVEDVSFLMPGTFRPQRTPEEREAARQRVMRHVTE